jgi:hypothetical protein
MKLTLELVVALVFTVVSPLYSWKIEYPRLLADVARGDPTARPRAYRRTILEQWLFVLAALAVWVGFGRAAATLGLQFAHPWRLAIGLAVAIGVVVFLAGQRRLVLARPSSPPCASSSARPVRSCPTPRTSCGCGPRFPSPPASARRSCSAAT